MNTLIPLHRLAIATALLVVARPSPSFAQSGGASVFGTIRDQDRNPLEDALVITGKRRAVTDSLGRYHLDSVAPGPARIIVRRIGFSGRDTSITARAGESVRWDVSMRRNDIEQRLYEGAKELAAAGGIDSIAQRLIKPNFDRALPFDAFGSHLFASLVARRGRDSNTVFSPLSAGIALSLVRMGAVGKTATTLDRVLGLTSLDRATIERRGAEMLSDLVGRTDVQLETANAIWVDTAAVLTQEFGASTRRWRSSISTLPLSSQRAVDVINGWADSVTHKKINKILNDPLSDTARLLVTNAVYFKGKWLTPFEKSATKPGDFTLSSGKRISVPRMERKMYVGYRRMPGLQVVRLPYRTGKTAMYVLLPDSGVSFDSLVTRIRNEAWMPDVRPQDMQEVRVVLPRFRSEAGMDLAAPLKEDLGAELPFTCREADFSAMARPRARDQFMPLCIASAFQKVYIDVDEEGTKAAAVTAIEMDEATAYHEPIQFIVDRPFLFVLRDEMSGADLFVGRIARP